MNDRTGIYVAKMLCFGTDCMASVIGSSRDKDEARAKARAAWSRRAAQAQTATPTEGGERA